MKKKILIVISFLCSLGTGLIIGSVMTSKILLKVIEEYEETSEKFKRLFRLTLQWLKLKQKNKSLSWYFKKNNYNNIAIYGMGNIGEALVKELLDSGINIKYAIDRNYNEKEKGFVVSPDSILEEVDAIVVTAVTSYGEIKLKLKEKIDCQILSIEDILYDV